MSKTRYRISIYSSNPDELEKFYRNVLLLKLICKIDVPNDYGYVFQLGESIEVFVAKHSQVKGNVKESFRHIFDIRVDNVKVRFSEILARFPKLNVIASPYQAPCSMVATFADPEGNCWQLSEA